jgi:hypothetical protein
VEKFTTPTIVRAISPTSIRATSPTSVPATSPVSLPAASSSEERNGKYRPEPRIHVSIVN